jgi:hypothetical protein
MRIKKLTALADETARGTPLEAWIARGWSEELMIRHGYLRLVADEAQAEPALPTVADLEAAYQAAHNDASHVFGMPASTPEEREKARAAAYAAFEALREARVRARAEAFSSGSVSTATGVVSSDNQLEHFKGCMYVQDLHGIIVPGLTDVLDQKRFDVRYSGVYELEPQKMTDSAWECFTASRIFKFPRVDATYFDPRDEPGNIRTNAQGAQAVNTFVPRSVERIDGDASPFVRHIQKILPEGYDAWILIAYLAACVQYPGVKSPWAPLLQGTEGNGKSVIVDMMARAIGREYTHAARASEIDGRFNAYLYGKLFIAFNEVKVSQDKAGVWETLKSYITDAWQQLEYKGGAIVQREMMFNVLFATNHADALPKTKDARRICPLFCAQQSEDDLVRDGMLDANRCTSVYFDTLYRWLDRENGYAITAGYLANYQIPDELNFAGRCKRAPRTTATEAAIEASMGPVEQEIAEAIACGAEGFRGGWIASHCMNTVIDKSQRARVVAKNKRRDIIKGMGYVPHPGLPDDGRAPVPLPDGQRPTLYVKPDHPTIELRGVAVADAYVNAQRAGTSAPSVFVPPQPPAVPYQ